MERVCEIFKAVSDPTRLRIFKVLMVAKIPLCGCDLVDILHEHPYNLSRHLKILKNAGLLKERKKGRKVYHFLREHNESFHKFLLKTISSVQDPTNTINEDMQRLNTVQKRLSSMKSKEKIPPRTSIQ